MGPAGRRHVSRADVVLDSNENAGQGADFLAAIDSPVQLPRLGEDGGIVGDVEEGAELGLGEPEAGEVRLGEVGGGYVAREEGVADGEDLGLWGSGGARCFSGGLVGDGGVGERV